MKKFGLVEIIIVLCLLILEVLVFHDQLVSFINPLIDRAYQMVLAA